MKGFLFNVGEGGNIPAILEAGVFGVRLGAPGDAVYKTLADYCTVKDGDKVFFFQERLIWGIGEVVGGPRLNYPNSLKHLLFGERPKEGPGAPKKKKKDQPPPSLALDGLLPDMRDALVSSDAFSASISVVIPFCKSPVMFNAGIDIDEVLGTPGFDFAWGMKFNWQRSFVQLAVEETRKVLEIFTRRFTTCEPQLRPSRISGKSRVELLSSTKEHQPFSLTKLVGDNPGHFVEGDEIRHESILHGLVAEAITAGKFPLALGTKDSLELLDVYHEFPASPAKPPSYIDRMDIIASASNQDLPEQPIHFEVIEMKKGQVPETSSGKSKKRKSDAQEIPEPDAIKMNLAQVMKYVDFMARNFAGGNYAAISASLIGSGFKDIVKEEYQNACTRTYVLDPHDRKKPSLKWSDFRFFQYKWDQHRHQLFFAEWKPLATTP